MSRLTNTMEKYIPYIILNKKNNQSTMWTGLKQNQVDQGEDHGVGSPDLIY